MQTLIPPRTTLPAVPALRSARLLGAVVMALSLFALTPARASYAITNIADTSGPFAVISVPAINGSGRLAFSATLDSGMPGIFAGSGGPTVTIADTNGIFSEFKNGTPRINNSGTVAFAAKLHAGGSGIFSGNGGPVATVVDTTGPLADGFSDPSINAAGTVAFETALDSNERGIFRVTGGELQTITNTTGQFASFFLPSLNDNGVVTFYATLDDGGQGIYYGTAEGVGVIADTNGPFSSVGESPAINHASTVAFFAERKSGGNGIFLGAGGPPVLIVDNSGPFIGFDHAVSVNASGSVLFYAALASGGHGLFTGPDLVADKVVRTGDALFGSTVSFLQIYTQSLNDAGQVGFYYQLADGRSGVAVATPGGSEPPTDPREDLQARVAVSCVDICWPGRTNRTYQVQYQSAQTSNTWVNLGPPVVGAGMNCLTDPIGGSAGRFYRIQDAE